MAEKKKGPPRRDRQPRDVVPVPLDQGQTLDEALEVRATRDLTVVPVSMEDQLSREARDYVIEMLAQFVKPDEIRVGIATKFGRGIDRAWIYNFKQVNTKNIGKARDTYLADFATIPLAHAKIRLIELQDMYKKAKKADDTWFRLEIMRRIKEECEPLMEALFPHGTDKDAQEFIQAIASGQTDLGSD